jgi:site-specific DNA recombinase
LKERLTMKIAIYARVSTQRQEKEHTIESQLEAIRKFARDNNHVIIEEYIDDGYSGEMLARPGLDRFRDDAPKGLFEGVLILNPFRLARNMIYQGIVKEELKKYKIKIIFLNRPERGDSPEEELLEDVQGVIAKYEKAKILERTRRGKLHKARQGRIIGSKAPYGYRYILPNSETGTDGHYIINDDEAGVVRLIFDLLLNSQFSVRSIVKELTRRRIRPRRGKHWRTSTVHKILRNETYTGITYYNKTYSTEPIKPKKSNGYRRTKNTSRRIRDKEDWIPIPLPDDLKIIDEEMFSAAQLQLERNAKMSPRRTKNNYLLRGVIECGHCGAPYHGGPNTNGLYYRCGNRSRRFPLPPDCNASSWKASTLEDLIWGKLTEILKNPKLIIRQLKKDQTRRVAEADKTEVKKEKIEIALERSKIEEDRLLEAYRAEIIDMVQLKNQMGEIAKNRATLEQQKLDLDSNSHVVDDGLNKEKIIKKYCKIVNRRLENLSFDDQQQIVKLLVNKIIIEDNKVIIKGVIPVESQSGPETHNTVSTSPV